MAVYDRSADASTAVTAFLSQFAIAANGNITYVSGSNTFHVWWLHRALQKKVWDFATSGDDYLNLGKPNPSTSEALGTIITLQDHTTNFSVRYNITDEVATYLFGGSVEQYNASTQLERYSGLKVLGSVYGTTNLQIVQNNTVLTSHWGGGKNQTDSSTLLRILVKTYLAGAAIDGSRVNVKASEWGATYAIWETTLGLGESVAAINTFSDPQNTTLLATVQAYGNIATAGEGIDLINVDGLGNKLFLGTWSYSGLSVQTKKALYERVKSFLVRGTSETLWGIDGDLYTGRVYDCVITTPRSGTWVQNEAVSWGTGATAGTGTLMGVDTLTGGSTARMVLHLNTGVPPAAAMLITGNGSATGTTSGTPAKLTTSPSVLGTFTGSAWIGAYGIGFSASELTFGDSVTSLNGETPTVPQNVTLTVNVTCDAGDVPHIFLAEKDPVLAAPDYNKYAAEGQTSGLGYIDIDTPIDADEPQTGWVGILHNGQTAYTFYEYTSWNNSANTPNGRFILSGTTGSANVASDPVFIAFMYDTATGAGTTKTFDNTFVFSSGTRDFIGWVRHGDPAAPDKPVAIAFNGVGSNSSSVTVVLDNES